MNKKIEDKINQGREYRTMLVEVRDTENEQMIVEGYATTFNEEYILWKDNDATVVEIVSDKAFDNCDMSDVIMQYNHEGRVFARNKNDTLSLTIDEHGLKTSANLTGTEIGRNLFEEIKGGYTDKMSIGFTVSDDEVLEETRGGEKYYVRKINAISKLWDVSAVSIPANDFTEISARHQIDGVIEEMKAECFKREEKKKAQDLRIKKLQARIKMMKGN